jgi:hypothetical protein
MLREVKQAKDRMALIDRSVEELQLEHKGLTYKIVLKQQQQQSSIV